MVLVKPGPDGVEAGSLLPAGQRLDEQLRLTYAQVMKNACMDLKRVMFVAHTFRVSPFTAREAYQRFYPAAHNGLTRAQFVHVMRESMNRGSGGDGEGLTDRGRELHRTFAIPDAPLDASQRPTPFKHAKAKSKLFVTAAWDRPGKADQGIVSQLADNIRSLESTIVLRESQKSTLAAASRFLDGSVTPRRISTASFIPSQRNLTMAARRPTTSDGRAVNMRGTGGNVMGLYGKTPFSRDQSGESGLATWNARTGGGSIKNPFSSVASTRPRTANEMGRTGKVKLGATASQEAESGRLSEDVENQSRALLDRIAARFRQMNLQRGDLLTPFQHYDAAGIGRISMDHARLAFAELDVSVSALAVREMATVAKALGPNDTVKYHILVGMLGSIKSGMQTLTKPPPPEGDSPAANTLSITGVPIDFGDALEQLAQATLQHRREVYWEAGGKPTARKRLTFGEQVRNLDQNHNGTCMPAELKPVLTDFGLSSKQANIICEYLTADNDKTASLGERGLIRYQLLLKMMHRETALRGKVAGWDSCPVFPVENLRSPKKVKVKTILDIQEPSERRRTGLASVYKKVTAHVMSTAKLRRAFEDFDHSNSGLLLLEEFQKALERVDVYLAEDETVILMEQLDPHKSGKVDYAKFIALMLPPEIVKEQDHVFGHSGGPESLNASLRAMADLTTEDVLKIFRDGCHWAMSKGPEQMKREYSMFKVSADAELTAADIKRFGQDFGLHLNERQCRALLSNIDAKNDGGIKFYHFMKAMLPQDAIVSEKAPKGTGDVKLADVELNEGFAARLRRQLLRKTIKGERLPVQLRRVFSALTGRDVQDAEIARALVDYGVLIDVKELSKYLNTFRSPYTGLVSAQKFIESVEPQMYEYVFPTTKACGGADLISVKKEVQLSDRDRDPHMWEGLRLPGNHLTVGFDTIKHNRVGHREVSDQEVRNCLRQSLANRLASDGARRTNFLKELRECDTSHAGLIGIDQFNVFLLKIGLKVEAEGNRERLWHSLVGDADTIELMRLSEILTSEFENVPRKSRDKVREKFAFR